MSHGIVCDICERSVTIYDGETLELTVVPGHEQPGEPEPTRRHLCNGCWGHFAVWLSTEHHHMRDRRKKEEEELGDDRIAEEVNRDRIAEEARERNGVAEEKAALDRIRAEVREGRLNDDDDDDDYGDGES